MPSNRKAKNEGTFLQKLRAQTGITLKQSQDSAASAYVHLARNLSGRAIDGNIFMRENAARLTPMLQPRHLGRMCSYFYDPKLKETLPYYDRFPLVIPVALYNDGFLGLNMHYLPMNRRAVLMDTLYNRVIKNSHMDERKRIMMTYYVVKAVSRDRNFLPCVKRYLYNHLRSKIYMIEPEDWNIALFVPTDRWAKASKSQVYQESIEKIRKAKGR